MFPHRNRHKEVAPEGPEERAERAIEKIENLFNKELREPLKGELRGLLIQEIANGIREGLGIMGRLGGNQ